MEPVETPATSAIFAAMPALAESVRKRSAHRAQAQARSIAIVADEQPRRMLGIERTSRPAV
jgi:hypothetical protein